MSTIVERLDLIDYLLIAEAITGIDAGRLARTGRIAQAESALAAPFAGFGEVERYPALAEKAAILCSRLVRNHPLPDGNKRAAYIAMLEFVERNGHRWKAAGDVEDCAGTIERLAARQIDEAEFLDWVTARVETGLTTP